MSVPAPRKRIVLRLCPCGSGKLVANCHLGIDGQLRKHLKSLNPPPPQTGFSHPRCYLSDTQDCSEEISQEHYVSRSVLEQIGPKVKVAGMLWLDDDQTLETNVDNLAAKILCKRHNEALSPLDQEAAFFSLF
jgi:hypothetical protein